MKLGTENEFDFVMMLNNKKIYELDINSQEMIHSIFYNIIIYKYEKNKT